MSNKSYKTTWSKIGNSSGFRIEKAFVKDYPQFAGVKGEVQVISSDTLLVRLQPKEIEREEEQDELMLSLFLDFVMETSLRDPNEIEKYTEEMAAEDDELMQGVIIDL
jgi:antitoxin PrlF